MIQKSDIKRWTKGNFFRLNSLVQHWFVFISQRIEWVKITKTLYKFETHIFVKCTNKNVSQYSKATVFSPTFVSKYSKKTGSDFKLFLRKVKNKSCRSLSFSTLHTHFYYLPPSSTSALSPQPCSALTRPPWV